MKVFRRFRKAMIKLDLKKARIVSGLRGNTEEREKAMLRITERLKEIGYNGRRDISTFSEKEQKEIMSYLPHVPDYLLDLLEKKPRE